MTLALKTQSDLFFTALSSYLEERGIPSKRLEEIGTEKITCLILDEPTSKDFETLENRVTPHAIIVLGNKAYRELLKEDLTFLEKPCPMEQIFKACEEVLKNTKGGIFLLGPYEIHLKKRRAISPEENKEIALTEKEATLLKILWHEKKVVSRQQLLESIWGYQEDIDTHTLETHIYKLRKKLFPENPESFLKTSPNGYSLKV